MSSKQNNLIIVCDPYTWVKSISGFVNRNPKDFILMVLSLCEDEPIFNYTGLCQKAVREQRLFDLYQIGKKIGIPKLINLNYSLDNINISQLTAQIQLQVMLGGIKNIYYQKTDMLDAILYKLSFITKTITYSFADSSSENSEIIQLSLEEFANKERLSSLIIGAMTIDQIAIFPNDKLESLHKVV